MRTGLIDSNTGKMIRMVPGSRIFFNTADCTCSVAVPTMKSGKVLFDNGTDDKCLFSIDEKAGPANSCFNIIQLISAFSGLKFTLREDLRHENMRHYIIYEVAAR